MQGSDAYKTKAIGEVSYVVRLCFKNAMNSYVLFPHTSILSTLMATDKKMNTQIIDSPYFPEDRDLFAPKLFPCHVRVMYQSNSNYLIISNYLGLLIGVTMQKKLILAAAKLIISRFGCTLVLAYMEIFERQPFHCNVSSFLLCLNVKQAYLHYLIVVQTDILSEKLGGTFNYY